MYNQFPKEIKGIILCEYTCSSGLKNIKLYNTLRNIYVIWYNIVTYDNIWYCVKPHNNIQYDIKIKKLWFLWNMIKVAS